MARKPQCMQHCSVACQTSVSLEKKFRPDLFWPQNHSVECQTSVTVEKARETLLTHCSWHSLADISGFKRHVYVFVVVFIGCGEEKIIQIYFGRKTTERNVAPLQRSRYIRFPTPTLQGRVSSSSFFQSVALQQMRRGTAKTAQMQHFHLRFFSIELAAFSNV